MSGPELSATAIVLREPGSIGLAALELVPPAETGIVVDVCWSGVSTGTERLLYTGRMPNFPGMGYPLVPGYEAAGIVSFAGTQSGLREGDFVFVPGSSAFKGARGLFGASASRIVASGTKAIRLPASLAEDSTLLALAATAHRALVHNAATLPDLIVGHGVLGRLAARLTITLGGPPPAVWETAAQRRSGAAGYIAVDPADDPRRDYTTILDVSGDPTILNRAIGHLAPGGEIILAGFYAEPLSFAFPPAFMREARFRVSAEFKPGDVTAVCRLIERQLLSLDGLITHRCAAADASAAYETAFTDPTCLKMVLDWRHQT